MLALPEQFVYLYNLSISTNIIPKDWKAGLVTPLPKKGDSSDPGKIRPISITHLCGKLLEKIVNQKLMVHLEDNDLFFKYQFGFRKGKSTSAAISKLVFDVNLGQNSGQYTVAIFVNYC